jgi:CRISPR/Cas system-associated exonuclease Cas4 (RecB family)
MAETVERLREKHQTLLRDLNEGSRPTIAPHKIAGQLYCEKKVDLAEKHGERENQAKQRGSDTHEKATEDAETVSNDAFWEAMDSDEQQIMVEFGFAGELDEFILAGKADAIRFNGQKPELIIDRKVTTHTHTVYDNQEIQPWLYGLMLSTIGFDTSELNVAILSHEPSLDKEVGKHLQNVVLQTAWEPGEHSLPGFSEANLFVSEFDPAKYQDTLNDKLEYWRDERDPVPTDTNSKCSGCDYNDVCSDAPGYV